MVPEIFLPIEDECGDYLVMRKSCESHSKNISLANAGKEYILFYIFFECPNDNEMLHIRLKYFRAGFKS